MVGRRHRGCIERTQRARLGDLGECPEALRHRVRGRELRLAVGDPLGVGRGRNPACLVRRERPGGSMRKGGTSMTEVTGFGWQELLLVLLALGIVPREIGGLLIALLFAWG